MKNQFKKTTIALLRKCVKVIKRKEFCLTKNQEVTAYYWLVFGVHLKTTYEY